MMTDVSSTKQRPTFQQTSSTTSTSSTAITSMAGWIMGGMSELPLKLWGLDPSFWSCMKLFIRTILTIPVYEPNLVESMGTSGTVVCNYAGHPVQKVEVVGMIVGVLIRSSLVSYTVDDGSGVIHCNCWYNQHAAFNQINHHSSATTSTGGGHQLPPPRSSLDSLTAAYRRQTPTESIGFISTPVKLLDLGNCVRVRGRIKQIHDRRELVVETIHVEPDANAEILHWLEVMQLMKNVYSKPSQILHESRSSHLAESSELARACIQWLTEKKRTTFTLQQLLETKEVSQLAQAQANAINLHRQTNSSTHTPLATPTAVSSVPTPSIDHPCTSRDCLESALNYLLQVGSILRPNAAVPTTYEVTSLRLHVIPLVFRLIASCSSKNGLHRDAIVSGVQQKYPNLTLNLIQEALKQLIEQVRREQPPPYNQIVYRPIHYQAILFSSLLIALVGYCVSVLE